MILLIVLILQWRAPLSPSSLPILPHETSPSRQVWVPFNAVTQVILETDSVGTKFVRYLSRLDYFRRRDLVVALGVPKHVFWNLATLIAQNSAPHASAGETGAQAVAMRVDGDMAAFYGCGFISSQDTICDEAGRHYFRDCYIEGNIDIIWGNGQSLYEVLTTDFRIAPSFH